MRITLLKSYSWLTWLFWSFSLTNRKKCEQIVFLGWAVENALKIVGHKDWSGEKRKAGGPWESQENCWSDVFLILQANLSAWKKEMRSEMNESKLAQLCINHLCWRFLHSSVSYLSCWWPAWWMFQKETIKPEQPLSLVVKTDIYYYYSNLYANSTEKDPKSKPGFESMAFLLWCNRADHWYTVLLKQSSSVVWKKKKILRRV